MGYTFYVYVWGQHDGKHNPYRDAEAYGGQSFISALLAMRQAKRDGFACIRLEWRP